MLRSATWPYCVRSTCADGAAIVSAIFPAVVIGSESFLRRKKLCASDCLRGPVMAMFPV